MQVTGPELIADGPQLSVGLLSADLLHLGDELDALRDTGTRLVHVDVMDGVFCPMTTVGPPVVAALPDDVVKDVHLMVDEPLGKVEDYIEAGAGIITIHVESARNPRAVLRSLAGTGITRGLALNPGTPIDVIEPLLDDLELVLLVAVDPGLRGQTMDAALERRIAGARALINGRQVALGVDGGVTRASIVRLCDAGVDLAVTGSAVFDGPDPHANAIALRAALRGEGAAVA